MRTEELIKAISEESKDNDRFEELKWGMPIGEDLGGNLVLAQKKVKPLTVRNTCVTGVGREFYPPYVDYAVLLVRARGSVLFRAVHQR